MFHDFSQDKILLENLSRIQYMPYGLSPDQTTYVLESLGCGWTGNPTNIQVSAKYSAEDSSTSVWLMSHDPHAWLKREPWERNMYIYSCLEAQSHSLLYEAFLPQLVIRDREHVELSNRLGDTIPALIIFPNTQSRSIYQFDYAEYRISYTYDDQRPIPFVAVGIGFTEEGFKTSLESSTLLDLRDPRLLSLLLGQMSVQYQKRHARGQ